MAVYENKQVITNYLDIEDSSTAPLNPVEGQKWRDDSATPPVLKVYQDGEWVDYQYSVAAQDPSFAKEMEDTAKAAEDAKKAGEEASNKADQAQADSQTALDKANNAVDKATETAGKVAGLETAVGLVTEQSANAVDVANQAKGNADTALGKANSAIGTAQDALNQSALAKSQAEEAIEKYLGMGMVPAWSWSADGTDRFTTGYPGENIHPNYLLKNTSAWRSWGVLDGATGTIGLATDEEGNGIYRITVAGVGNISDGFGRATDYYVNSASLGNPGDKVTYYAEYKFVTGYQGVAIKLQQGNANGGWTSTITPFSDNEWHRIKLNFAIQGTNSATSYYIGINGNVDGDAELWIRHPKIEKGKNTDPIYTPSPSEDYANAVPSYIGFAIEPSDNPADYTWIRNPEKVEGEVKVELTDINGELKRKVSQETFDQLNSTVINHSTLISQNQNAIKLKADQSTVDTINQTVADHSTAIDLNAEAIALKANQSTVDSLTGRVTEAEGSITTIAGQVALKANQSVVDTMTNTVNANSSELTVQAGKITALTTKTDGHTTQIGSLQSGYDGLSSTVSKVESDLNGVNSANNLLSGFTFSNNKDINLTTGDEGVGSRTIVDDFIPVLPNTKYTFSRPEKIKNVGFRGYKSDKTYIGPVANTAGSERTTTFTTQPNCYFVKFIDESNKLTKGYSLQIALATVTEMSNLTQTVNTIQSTVASKADQSQITQLSDAINLRVEKDDIINQININDQGVLIAGEKVHITGLTTIDDAVIKTANIVDLNVTEAKLGNLSVSTAKIADAAITSAKIGTAAIGTAHIGDAVITDAKIQSISAEKIQAETLSAISANLGEITSGRIRIPVTTKSSNGSTTTGYVVLDQNGLFFENDYDKFWFSDGVRGESKLSTKDSCYYGYDGLNSVSDTGAQEINLDVDRFYMKRNGAGGHKFEINPFDDSVCFFNNSNIFKFNGNSEYSNILNGAVQAKSFETATSKLIDNQWILNDTYTNLYAQVASNGYFRVTTNSSQSTYRPVQASNYYGSSLDPLNGDYVGLNRNSSDKMNFFVGKTADGVRRMGSDQLYSTSGSGKALHITSGGTIVAYSSSERFKELILPADDVNYKALLDLDLKSWVYKSSHSLALEGEPIRRVYGLIAEDVERVGLTQYTEYNQAGQVEGYKPELWTLTIPILNEHEKEIQILKEKVQQLENEIRVLQAA